MTTTSTRITTDQFEVFGDATFVASAEVFGPADFVAAADRHDDALAVRERDRDLLSATALSAIEVPPSDLPAVELPDYEPTVADLMALEHWTDDRIDERLASANTASAVAARHRDLVRLRAALPATALVDEPDETGLERAA